jgi:hypothetical protein
MENRAKNVKNLKLPRRYIIIFLISILAMVIFYLLYMNNSLSETVNSNPPLRRRNAMTEDEIKKILGKDEFLDK